MRKNNTPKKTTKAKTAVVASAAAATAAPVSEKNPEKKIGVADFIRLTRSEIGRITWPTRKETTMTTIMVFIMVTILSIFFFLVDQILSYGIKVLLG